MKAVTIHGVLLVGALLLAFVTWTGGNEPATGSGEEPEIIVWRGSPDQIRALEYAQERRMLTLERREESGRSYLWGTSVQEFPDTSDRAPRHEQFPVSEAGDELLARVAPLKALRQLGALDDSAKAVYALTEPDRRLTVTFRDGPREMLVGAAVYGGAHRYALDPGSGRGYVLPAELMRVLEGGRASLQSRELHRYKSAEVAGVTLRTSSGQRIMARSGGTGAATTWARPDNPAEPDQTFANFMQRIDQLGIVSYDADFNADTAETVLRIDYARQGGEPLGFLELYRVSSGPDGGTDYFLRTESTQIPARVYRSLGERVDQDLADII